MALADRLNQIVSEQNISKTEFARRLGQHRINAKIRIIQWVPN